MLLLEQLITLIDEGCISGSQLVTMQNYMLQRGHIEQVDLSYDMLRDRETGGKSTMILVQWFEERGIEKGIEKGTEKGTGKGVEKGIQQGGQEVSQEFALRLLSKGMPREDVAEIASLPPTETDKLIN